MRRPIGPRAVLAASGGVALLVVAWALARRPAAAVGGPVAFTVGDVRAMHADVRAGDREVRGSARLSDGQSVVTGPDGRARLRLDDGTLVVVDRSTQLSLQGARVVLGEGRIFVRAGVASRTEVAVGGAVAMVSSTAAAFEVGRGKPAKIYCAKGEVVVTAGDKPLHVASGETATLGDGAHVAPEVAFDDWTGGLAVPWSGSEAPSSAIAELWGGGGDDQAGAPLVVRSEDIHADIDGEVAVTHARTRYFNGSESSVQADVRTTLPPGAIVSRVAFAQGDRESEATLAIGNIEGDWSVGPRLEWAGGGSLRGLTPSVAPGDTVDLLIDYVEWLPQRSGRATYRFPMSSDASPPLVGDLSARVQLSGTAAPWVSASAGASVAGRTVDLRRADVRPTGDLVVELAPSIVRPGVARAYVTPGEKGEDPYVLVRTEVPDTSGAGITLALVVDVSMSMGPSLETERAVVDAVLEGLGPRDSIVVLAADETARTVGPAKPASVTDDVRASVRSALVATRAGGASNLAAALETAADLVDTPDAGHSGSGMVVYLGDGRPTVGEATAADIRRRLGRRASGLPRLGAVAVGYGADRWTLAQVVAASGPVYRVLDRADAAHAGAAIVADALEPTLRDVDLDLGPTIDRIYPREARAALAGSTVTVTGRLRGKLPERIGFRFRRGPDLVEERRPLEAIDVPDGADVPRRWAAARIQEMAARGDGIQASIALAAQARLLTPWTGWFLGPPTSAPFPWRVLELSPALDAAFAAVVEPELPPPSLPLDASALSEPEGTLEDAAREAAIRAIHAAIAPIAACRDARAAARSDLPGALEVALTVGLDGRPSNIRVFGRNALDDDAPLDRCVRGVVAAIPFFPAGSPVPVTTSVTFPDLRGARRTQCSTASALPLPVRRGIWRARSRHAQLDYTAAARWCELPTWNDRRELLQILIEAMGTSVLSQGPPLAERLEAAGERDAAQFVRQELVRHLSLSQVSPIDLRRALIGAEPKIDRELEAAYRKARNDDARMEVLRRFVRVAPHSSLARRRLLALLEALGQKDALLAEIQRVRLDPVADAALLAAGASALRRLGMGAEGRRAFGELIERAPGDPWTLAYVGDRLRAEGLFDDALAAYERLDRSMPDDPAVALRLALAQAGAGRLDAATRLLDRVAQTGGRGDDGRLGELASITAATLLMVARQGSPPPDADALLVRRLVQTPLPDVGSLILVRTQPVDDPVEVRVARGDKAGDDDAADLEAGAIGLSAIRVERGSATTRIRLRRRGAAVDRPVRATVTALVLADDRASAKLVTRDVDVMPGDTGVELRWTGESLL